MAVIKVRIPPSTFLSFPSIHTHTFLLFDPAFPCLLSQFFNLSTIHTAFSLFLSCVVLVTMTSQMMSHVEVPLPGQSTIGGGGQDPQKPGNIKPGREHEEDQPVYPYPPGSTATQKKRFKEKTKAAARKQGVTVQEYLGQSGTKVAAVSSIAFDNRPQSSSSFEDSFNELNVNESSVSPPDRRRSRSPKRSSRRLGSSFLEENRGRNEESSFKRGKHIPVARYFQYCFEHLAILLRYIRSTDI